jgi:hypothetical protein
MHTLGSFGLRRERQADVKGRYAYPGDLLANYPKKVVAFDESVVNKAPDSPEGLSGGSVWRYAPVEHDKFWAVQKAMRIVGIQLIAFYSTHL